MWLYVSSSSSPDSPSSRCQEYSSGTTRSGFSRRVARSSAILRNSKNVSCSVYSYMLTPASRSTLLPATSLATRRRDSVTGTSSRGRHFSGELTGEGSGEERTTKGLRPLRSRRDRRSEPGFDVPHRNDFVHK